MTRPQLFELEIHFIGIDVSDSKMQSDSTLSNFDL